jgi:hypothetical protein
MILGTSGKIKLRVRNVTSNQLEDLSQYANIIVYLVQKQESAILKKYSRETKTGYLPITVVDNYNYSMVIDSAYTKSAKSGQLQIQFYGEIVNVDYPTGKEFYICEADLLYLDAKLLINSELP